MMSDYAKWFKENKVFIFPNMLKPTTEEQEIPMMIVCKPSFKYTVREFPDYDNMSLWDLMDKLSEKEKGMLLWHLTSGILPHADLRDYLIEYFKLPPHQKKNAIINQFIKNMLKWTKK